MNFFKRGLQNLWAKKGRSVMMIAVFCAILTFVLAGLTIRSGTLVATENAQKSVGATVTLQTNREQAFQKTDSETSDGQRPDPSSFDLTPVSLADAQNIAALDGIASYNFEVSTSTNAVDNITAISNSESETTTSSTSSDSSDSTESNEGVSGQREQMPEMANQGDFQVTGVSTSDTYSTFTAGTATLTDGKAITEEDKDSNYVLIEKTLAEANDLAVGDTFTITDADSANVEVKIKGIYETSEVASNMGMMFNFMNPANTLIASYTLVNSLQGNEETVLDTATYTLSDPKMMDTFVKEAEALIDTDTLSLETNDQTYQSMIQPLNNIASFAKNIIILVAVAGVIILTLIVMLSIRERRYEIGVLLSLGESRLKVIFQFFTEIFICMLFALAVASALGNVVGNLIGDQLLAQQTTTKQVSANAETPSNSGPGGNIEQPGNGRPQAGGNVFTQSTEIQELNITVKPQEFGILAVMGLGITFSAVLLSSAGILRLNPKKILIA